VEGSAVGTDVRLQVEPLAAGKDGHAVVADGTVDEDLVAGTGAAAADVELVVEDADSRGIDEDLVRLPPGDHLGVAGDDGHSGGFGRLLHAGENGPEVREGKTLLQNQADADRQGTGAAHGQVVDRSVNRQIADVAAGEEDRVDHVGVGGEGEPAAAVGQDRGVVLVPLGHSGEGGDDDLVEKLVAEPAAAAVA